jgi:DNA-binding transcriptional regulator YiaG
MKTTKQAFAIRIPDASGEHAERVVTFNVPVRWDETIDEWVLTEEAHEIIDRRKALEMGLLSPEQLRELREKHGLNQKQMGQLFQVGEKSWCRWESGKHRPTRSINLLIRALYDGEISLHYLRARAGMPEEEPAVSASMEVWWTAVRTGRETRPASPAPKGPSRAKVEVDFLALGGRNRQFSCFGGATPAGSNQELDLDFTSAS